MNKQDILNQIEWHLEETEGENASGTFDQGYKEGCYHCEALIERLDEPQKVKVPECVAGYIVWCHSEGLTLWEVFKTIRGMPEKVWEWLKDEEHQAIFSKAYTDGYEVEEEPKWVVKYKPGNLENNWYFIGFCGGDRTLQPNCANRIDCDTVIKFKDRSKAEAVATLIDGTVEKV